MQSSTTHNVTDLAESDKRSLEHLLGGRLGAMQQVTIVAFTPDATTPESNAPGKAPPAIVRARAATRIEQTLEKAAAHAASVGATDHSIDEAVDLAMNEIRRRPAL